MRHLFFVAAGVLMLAAGRTAISQTNQAEDRPPTTPPALVPAPLAAAPADADAGAAQSPGYLGVVPDEVAQMTGGVRLLEVRRGAPAETAGLRANDVITAIDGKTIASIDDLDEALTGAAVGQRLRVTVLRNGQSESMDVTLGTRPARPGETAPAADPPATTLPAPSLAPPTDPLAPRPATPPALPDTRPPSLDLSPARPELPADDLPRTDLPRTDLPPTDLPPREDAPPGITDGGGRATLGVTVVPLTDEARALYGLTGVRRGALITALRVGSPAEAAGLPIGGAIVRFDSRQIDSPDDLVAAVNASRAGQEAELMYYQGDRLRRAAVRLAPAGVASIPTLPPTPVPLPAPRPATPEAPPRPLLSRVERAVDNLARVPLGTYDPSEMAAMRQRIEELTSQVQALEQRLQALEGRPGGGAFPAPPAPGFPDAGGFGIDNPAPPATSPPATSPPGATTPLTLPPTTP